MIVKYLNAVNIDLRGSTDNGNIRYLILMDAFISAN